MHMSLERRDLIGHGDKLGFCTKDNGKRLQDLSGVMTPLGQDSP